MTRVLMASCLGLVAGGWPGAVLGILTGWALEMRSRRRDEAPGRRLVMMLLVVELRSGASVLSAIQSTAAQIPEHGELSRLARVATVSGLAGAIGGCDESLRPIVAQLARAQRSGASLTGSLRHMLEQDLSQERSDRIARARTLPIRLMLPVTLLMLPGLVLLLYAPALIRTFDQITGGWS